MQREVQYFETRFVYDPKRDVVWKEICRFLQMRYIPEGSTILDIGSGYGGFINNIRGRERHALDVSSKISECVQRDVITHIQPCAEMTNFSDGSLDIIFASNVFEHLTRGELLKTLGEVKRILRVGGKLIVIQPNFRYCYREYFDDYTHIQIFTHTGLCDLLVSTGFRIADCKPRFLPFSMRSKLPKVPILMRLYLRFPLKPFASQMLIVAQKEN
jgi:SAM-dependent methyltransferase